jgi:hypothetical protein
MNSFPLYLLKLGDDWKVVFPEDRADIPHPDFWEQTVSHIVARHYRIPQKRLANLPYCQRRARVVGNKVYMGARCPDPKLVTLVRESLGNEGLTFAFDEHERRLREDVRQFKRLVRRHRPA